MSKASYLLMMPRSVKAAAARLAKEGGVSLNQFIAVAVAEKVGTIDTAEQFLKRRAMMFGNSVFERMCSARSCSPALFEWTRAAMIRRSARPGPGEARSRR